MADAGEVEVEEQQNTLQPEITIQLQEKAPPKHLDLSSERHGNKCGKITELLQE